MTEKTEKDIKSLKKALATLCEVCITPKHEDRDDFIIRVNENNKKLKKAIETLED